MVDSKLYYFIVFDKKNHIRHIYTYIRSYIKLEIVDDTEKSFEYVEIYKIDAIESIFT